MIIIGITGGIASGKSIATSVLQMHGANTVDCDAIAKANMMKGQPAYDEIMEHYGRGILQEDGEISRKKLADIVFGNKDELKRLNEITHKYVYNSLELIIKEEQTKNTFMLAIEASVPDRETFRNMADEVWTVVSNKRNRINRIIERDATTGDKAAIRIESQIPDQEYMKMADHVIMNNGSIDELKDMVSVLYQKIVDKMQKQE